jgi:hypothetical protein
MAGQTAPEAVGGCGEPVERRPSEAGQSLAQQRLAALTIRPDSIALTEIVNANRDVGHRLARRRTG